MEDLKLKSDHEIAESIARINRNLQLMVHKLPDKGEKLKAVLVGHELEFQRRKKLQLQKAHSVCEESIQLSLHSDEGALHGKMRSSSKSANLVCEKTGDDGHTVVRSTPFLINETEQAAPITDNQASVATSNMKRIIKKNLDTNDKSTPMDETMNEESCGKNQPPSVGQLVGKSEGEVTGITENLSHCKKVRSKRGISSEQKNPTTDSSGLRGGLSNELKCLQASAEGSKVDSVNTRTEEFSGKEDVTKAIPFVAESDTKQPGGPLAPLTMSAQEGSEGDAASAAPKRKRGRPPMLRVVSPKTPVPVIHETVSVPSALSTQKVPLTKDRLPNENSAQNVNSQRGWGTKKDSARKGKRGKRRMISLNNESPAQVSQDASKEKAEGSLEKESTTRNPEASVEESPDTASDDQPLSRLLEGKRSPTIVHGQEEGTSEERLEVVPRDMNSRNLPFVKTTPLWKTIESMEAFRMLPQEPHFRSLLQGVTEGAREGLAIGTMVTFSSVYEKTRGLSFDDPKSTIEECLETLEELENNGFNVVALRKRLTRLLEIKKKQEKLKEETKQVADKMEERNVEGRKIEEEMEELDRQMRELENRRKEALLKKEKGVSKISEMEAEKGRIGDEMKEVVAEFDGVAAAPIATHACD